LIDTQLRPGATPTPTSAIHECRARSRGR